MPADCGSHLFNISWYHREKMWSINPFSMHNQLTLQTLRRFLKDIFFPKHIYFFVVFSVSDLSFIITQQPMVERVNHYFYKTYRSSEHSLVFHSSDRKSDAAIILSYKNFGAKWRITPPLLLKFYFWCWCRSNFRAGVCSNSLPGTSKFLIKVIQNTVLIY